MPHSIVVAQFDPVRGSYWLPVSGRLATRKILTQPFLAYALSFHDFANDKGPPFKLCVISSRPSPIPLRDASLTIGPKVAIDANAFYVGDNQLIVIPPLPCRKADLRHPTYVHTVPSLTTLMSRGALSQTVLYQLDEDSFRQLTETASRNRGDLIKYWNGQREARWALAAARWQRCDVLEASFMRDDDPTSMFSYLNNPHAYCFDFFDVPFLPCVEDSTHVYNEFLVYGQLCKDYRWEGVEESISWVRDMRTNHTSGWRVIEVPSEDSEVDYAYLLSHDPAFKAAASENLLSCKVLLPQSDDSDSSADQNPSYDSQDDLTSWCSLSWGFPEAPWSYPRIPLTRPRIAVFDLFGTVLDRETAIQTALQEWLPLASRSYTMREVLELYIEVEALAVREQGATAVSLAAICHSALRTLSGKLKVSLHAHPTLLANSLATILKCRPYHDVDPFVRNLVQQGCALMVIPPHSGVSMQHLLPMLPHHVGQHMHVCSEALSIHFAARTSFFSGALIEQCKQLLPDVLPAEVLLVSTSVARVLAPASLAGHPTALVKRPGTIASNVDFVIGVGNDTPATSVVVDGLEELCASVQGAGQPA
ncbi:hypothetical protein BD414DRAFT_468920 [Trametes punicea]|nr:hypothetical protein BD414DRAFT_468920 [Trametes punicea]